MQLCQIFKVCGFQDTANFFKTYFSNDDVVKQNSNRAFIYVYCCHASLVFVCYKTRYSTWRILLHNYSRSKGSSTHIILNESNLCMHGIVLQISDCSAFPLQSWPSNEGVGLSHSLWRCRWPIPHVTEQEPHSAQFDQPPSSEKHKPFLWPFLWFYISLHKS